MYLKDSYDDFISLKNKCQFSTHESHRHVDVLISNMHAQASLARRLAQGTPMRHKQDRVESSRPKGSKGADLKIEQFGHNIEDSPVCLTFCQVKVMFAECRIWTKWFILSQRSCPNITAAWNAPFSFSVKMPFIFQSSGI